MPTVWITQERQGFNYTDAERFGDIQFVTAREYTLPTNSPGNAMIRSMINEAVNKFDPDEDSLLLSGSPVIAGVFIGGIISKHDPKVIRIIKWDNRETKYGIMPIQL